MISEDGSHIAFVSEANVLSDDDNNLYNNVFVRDIGAPAERWRRWRRWRRRNDTTKPRVSRVGMSRKRFKVGKKRTPVSAAVKAGTTFRYSLSEESTVRITIARALPGRRAASAPVRAARRAGAGPIAASAPATSAPGP